MLLLLTIGLVLVGAVALVIGFVSSSQLPIFISIACSIAAGIVLAVFSRMSRRAAAPATAGSGPAPLVEPTTASPDLDEAAEAGDLVRTQAVPVVGDTFPIEDYDDLLVSEILPLLPELDLDELDLVREREESGKKRSSILKRIDQLAEELEGEEPPVAVAAVEEVEVVEELEDELEDEGEREDAGLGIANYDSLKVPQILAQLDDLSDEQLDEIAEYEERHANRRAIIEAIDNMFEEGPVEAAPVKAAAKAPAKKVVAKKSAVRSTAKKAAPVKSASSSTRAAAKKASPAKKAAARSAAPAKKAAAKKAAAKKAPAKSAGKKSAAKKASPAKKAAKRR